MLCLVLAVVAVALYLRPDDDEPAARFDPALDAVPNSEFRSTPPLNPFAGSPADTFASGAAGIAPPGAKAAGSFTAAQVATALHRTRQLLSGGALDPTTLGGGRPEKFLRLLHPQQRAALQQALEKPTKRNDPTAWISRFDPRDAALVGSAVKVRGTITYRAVDRGDVLRVHTDHLYVYAVRSVRPQTTETSLRWTRVVAHQIADLDFRRARTSRPRSGPPAAAR